MENLNQLSIRGYLIKNHGFRPFDRKDWSGYAGAEKFSDGSDPIIKNENDFDVIYDGLGFSFESQESSISFNIEQNGRTEI